MNIIGAISFIRIDFAQLTIYIFGGEVNNYDQLTQNSKNSYNSLIMIDSDVIHVLHSSVIIIIIIIIILYYNYTLKYELQSL